MGVVSAFNFTDPYVYIHIMTSEITVEEEYKIYDLSGIIGTVGGSLGLFIGFSFLDCTIWFLSHLRNSCEKKGK